MTSAPQHPDGAVLAREPRVLSTEVGGTTVLLNDDAELVHLDPVGSRIWELAATPLTVGDLVAVLAEEYGVPPAQCRADIAGFLTSLVAHRVVTVTEPGR